MQRGEAFAVMTMWEARGAWHSSRHRATAVSMVTASKERPSSSALSVRFIDPSRRTRRVVGMPAVGPLGVNSGRGRPFAHAQAGVLVGAEELPELEVFVARQALEPTPVVTPKHGDAADKPRVCRAA